ncbi:MAG TPA: ATP-dependent 6-phosphofructokinase [Kiloniellales bacterium]|nr:ATP-dependent 6-phosphofructokinase [Kiloniellales bacterium]
MAANLRQRDLRRLGVLTSGGDCAGLNAALRGIVLAAAERDVEVWGIRNGLSGLLAHPPEAELLAPADFDGTLLRRGGTILGTTNRGDPFAFPNGKGGVTDRSGEAIDNFRRLGLDALVAIGGDGSLRLLQRLARQGGIPLVAIPKTIDNDVDQTELSIGYASAVEVATMALDHLQPTAASHGRIMVLEVMGRDAGHIALAAAIAGGADVALIPEIPHDLESVAAHLLRLKAEGKTFALVVVSEAVRDETGELVTGASGGSGYGGVGHGIARRLAALTGWESRVTILGHLQRGGPPGARDRLMAQIFGVHAVELALAGEFDRMVAWSGRRVVSVPLSEAVANSKAVDPTGPLVATARALGMVFGDEAR